MGPRGRGGNFRGRGSRGRGRGGRGGRGQSFSKYGPNRRFDATRLAEEEDDDSEDMSDVPSEAESEDQSEVESEEEEEAAPSRPYMALLQSFHDSSAPNAKRRKIEHSEPASKAAESSEGESGDDEDEDKDADVVEEEEGEDQDEVQEQDLSDSDDEDNSTDPFDVHFAHPDELASAKGVKAAKEDSWTTKRSLMGPFRATAFSTGADSSFTPSHKVDGVSSLQLKQKLQEPAAKKLAKLDEEQRTLASLMFDYRDILYTDRSVKNSEKLRQMLCLHALNHVFKTRDRVLKDNYKLTKDGADTELELRDQGFTRPKVLFLLPTRNSCARMVKTIRDLCNPDQEENRKRFDESYVEKENNFGADRPSDFTDLFEGNDDDMFRLGVKFTRKTIKYFSQFYNSDILFASPLGLRMAIGSEEEKGKKEDYDFLSSIEMVIVDQTDALLMQNWEHVEYIFEHLNLQPKDAHDCDFSRVRSWYLEDWAKYFRQTIITSSFNTPELAELQRRHCHNWAGKVRLQPEYPGVLQQLGVKAKQTFSRFQASSLDRDPEARFEYFISAIVPNLVKRAKDTSGTLIYVPSYLDFVRVRNYFATSMEVSNVTFGAISEYTDVPEASRARSHFVTGRHKILLYSERAHHFRRLQIKGVQRVVFYGLPDNPIFYKEIAGGYLSKSEEDMTIDPGKGTVRVMFSKYDAMKLERVAGSKRVGKMIQDRGNTFDFV